MHRRAVIALMGAGALLIIALLIALPSRFAPSSSGTTDPTAVSAPQPASLGDAAVAGSAATTVELCGYGRVAAIREETDYPPGVVASAQAALQRATDELVDDPAPSRRATGLYLRNIVRFNELAEQYQRAGDCPDPGCISARLEQQRLALAPQVQQLARLALETRDPRAYSIALRACRHSPMEPCPRLSTAQWAELDPDNAAPWLWLAGEAAERKDEAGLAAALARAARAQTSDLLWPQFGLVTEHAAARSLPPAPRMVLLTRVVGVAAAMPIPNYSVVTQFCAPPRVAGPARRQLCSDLATPMTERPSSLMEFAIGIRLGERAGWPATKVKPLADQKEAIMALEDRLWPIVEPHGCAALKVMEARAEEFFGGSELAAGRRRIAESGQSAAQLAHEWRQRRAEPEGALRVPFATPPAR
jgi:hypothetical protein